MLKAGLKIIASYHFWIIVLLLVVCLALHYPQQLLGTSTPSVFSPLGLTRHALERILILLPVSYAGFIFGMKAGLVTLVIGAVIMIPRIFTLSEYFGDSLLETASVIVVGILINVWMNIFSKEKARRQHILADLEATHKQLQIHNADLEKSERRYRELFENALDAIWEQDLEGNIVNANLAGGLICGCSQKELIGTNVKSFMTESSLELAKKIKHSLLSGEDVEQPYEQQIVKKDGSIAILHMTTNPIKENGELKGFLNIARDVTKEKKTQEKLNRAYEELRISNQQLKESQEKLIQAEKLTSLGQMAASVAHEVNNPLSGVLVYTQLLIKKLSGDSITKETALEYLSKMESELVRATKIILDLLDFARQSPPTFRDVDINEVVNRSLDLATHSAERIQVQKELDPSLPKIMADFDQLRQVFTNLILNAIQAMPTGGKLVIRTSMDGKQIRVDVKDTGYGISPENMRRLFTPFFTTKREVKGVGLGLAVAYGIVQRHKGKIEVQSKKGEGTTFSVFFPISSDENS